MSTQPHETEEYKAGQAAARQGHDVIACPYTLDTPQGELWVQGWEAATDNMQRVAGNLAASALAAGGIMEHPKTNTGADVSRLAAPSATETWERQPKPGETITDLLGGKVYTFREQAMISLDIQIGATPEETVANMNKVLPARIRAALEDGKIFIEFDLSPPKVQPIMAAGSDNPPRKAGTTPLHLEAGKIVQKHITHQTATPDYCRGFEARKEGKNLWDNPNATTSHAHAEWKRGWETAHHLGSARREASPETTVLPVSELAKPWPGQPNMPHVPIPEEVKQWFSDKQHAAIPPVTMEQAKEAWNMPSPEGTPDTDDMNKAITPACPFCDSDNTRTLASYLPRHPVPNGVLCVCLACNAQGPRQRNMEDAIASWGYLNVVLNVPPGWRVQAGFIERMEGELRANEPQKGPFSEWKPTAVQAMEELLHHVRKLATWTDKCEQVPTIMAGHEPEMLNVARYQASQKAAELAADVGNIAMKVWEIFGNAPLPSVAAETDPNKAPA